MRKGFDFWSILTSRLFWAVAIVALIALGVGISRNIVRQHQISMEIKSLNDELVALETKQDSLQALLQYIETPEFKEREARLRLGLKRAGEKVIIVPGGGGGIEYLTTSSTLNKQPTWRLWYDYFFK